MHLINSKCNILVLKTLNPHSCMISHRSWSWTIVYACNNIDFQNPNYVMVSWFSFHELYWKLLHDFQMLFLLNIGVWLWWWYDGIEDLNYILLVWFEEQDNWFLMMYKYFGNSTYEFEWSYEMLIKAKIMFDWWF